MCSRVHDHVVGRIQSLLDDDELVVGRADQQLAQAELAGRVADHAVVFVAALDDGLHGNLHHFRLRFDADRNLGRHPRLEHRRRSIERDDRIELLHVRVDPVLVRRIRIDGLHGSLEFCSAQGLDPYDGGHARLDAIDARLADLRLDLHLAGVGQHDDHLSFADAVSLADQELIAAPAVLVRKHDLPGGRSLDDTLVELAFEVLQFFEFDPQLGLLGEGTGFGGLDVGVMLLQRLGLGVLADHVEFGLRRPQVLAELLDREPIAFKLHVGDVAARRQLLAVRQKVLGPARVFLGDEQLALQFLLVLHERPQLVFLPRNDGGGVIVGGLAESRFGRVDRDFLCRQIFAKGRVVQLHDDLVLGDGRSFGDDLQDANALGRRDLAPQLDVRGTLQFAPLDDVGEELTHDGPLRGDIGHRLASQ